MMAARELPSAFDLVASRARVRSATTYILDDEVVESGTSDTQGTPAAPSDQPTGEIPPLVRQLQHHLYDRCYLGRTVARQATTMTDLTPALAAANVYVDRWDPGWVIARIHADGSVLVTREGQARSAWPGEYHSTQVGVPPVVGATVRLFVPHEAPMLQAGFYHAFGDDLGDQLQEIALVRLYWHVSADDAPDLLHALVTAFRRYRIPFRLKALTARETYPRPDALVVYVAQRLVPLALRITRLVHPGFGPRLGDGVPLFSREVTRGVGLAEDPGNGESFGMSRCRVVAEGLWNAFVTGVHDEVGVRRLVREHASRCGLDPDRPHLNPGSTDAYIDDDIAN